MALNPTFIESYQTEEYDFCDRVIEQLESFLNDDKTHVMRGAETNGNVSNRKDFSVMFDQISSNGALQLLGGMHRILGNYLPLYVDKYPTYGYRQSISSDMKVQKTPPKGGFHYWHSEQGGDKNSAYRNLTWTLYLNDIPEGEGETEFIEYGIKVQPKKGLLCFFPAGFTHAHRGNPVYSQDKYIATGWYYLMD